MMTNKYKIIIGVNMRDKQELIQVRVDEGLKRDATAVLERLEIDVPTAIRLFLRRVVLDNGLPFDVKLPDAEDKHIKHNITYIPAEPVKRISRKEYYDAVCRVPKGRLTRDDDIRSYLAKKYEVDRIEFNEDCYVSEYRSEIPFWRIVTTRGYLTETMFCSKEFQQNKLKDEGLEVVACGANGRSLAVKDYMIFLFDYNSLCV